MKQYVAKFSLRPGKKCGCIEEVVETLVYKDFPDYRPADVRGFILQNCWSNDRYIVLIVATSNHPSVVKDFSRLKDARRWAISETRAQRKGWEKAYLARHAPGTA